MVGCSIGTPYAVGRDEHRDLAGFIDGDGNFNLTVTPRPDRNTIRTQLSFRLELRAHYHRASFAGTSFSPILTLIGNALGVRVYDRSRA